MHENHRPGQDEGSGTEPAEKEHRLPLRFVGSGSEYFRIWIVNLLLTLVTLGVYYPFAKVRRLRYFHGATEVGGHPLAFHADPKKMLRGYFLVGVLVGLYSLAGQVSPTAGLVAFVIVAALWPLLWHSSLRFRLANTGWRGLRFSFVGSSGGAYLALAPGYVLTFALLAVGLLAGGDATVPSHPAEPLATAFIWWALLPLLLLFLALPGMVWLPRRYQHNHFALGREQTWFGVPLRAFYGLSLRGLGVSLLALLIVLAVGALWLWAVGSFGLRDGDGTGASDGAAPPQSPLIVLLPLLLVLFFQVTVRPYFTARFQNLVWNGTRSPRISFVSQLRYRPLLVLTLKNWLLFIVTLGLYHPFAAIATARLRLEVVQVLMHTDPERLVASAASTDETAAGDAAGDLLGLDIGL